MSNKTSEVSLTNRLEEMEDSIWGLKINPEEMDSLVKENVKSKNVHGQNV